MFLYFRNYVMGFEFLIMLYAVKFNIQKYNLGTGSQVHTQSSKEIQRERSKEEYKFEEWRG